jgi:hypothetical protein
MPFSIELILKKNQSKKNHKNEPTSTDETEESFEKPEPAEKINSIFLPKRRYNSTDNSKN